MGVWLRANGRLEVVPPPDEKLMVKLWVFSNNTWPEDYKRMDEHFHNTWFFDKDNRLACTAGKFAEPSIWLKWMKTHFFEPRGYELVGNEDIIGEGDYGVNVFDRKIEDEYFEWLGRIKGMCADFEIRQVHNRE